MGVEKEEDIPFEIRVDEKRFRAVGNIAQAAPGRWVGVKGRTVGHEREGAVRRCFAGGVFCL